MKSASSISQQLYFAMARRLADPAEAARPLLQVSLTKQILAPRSSPPAKVSKTLIRVNPLVYSMLDAEKTSSMQTSWNPFADGLTRNSWKNGLHILQRRPKDLSFVYINPFAPTPNNIFIGR